jgi:hypothetical protein
LEIAYTVSGILAESIQDGFRYRASHCLSPLGHQIL